MAAADFALSMVSAVAVRENVVRIGFTIAPLFTDIDIPFDASNRARYSVTTISTSIGLDGEFARVVNPVEVTSPSVVGAIGMFVDVTVDRPFTPFPSQYRVSCNNLVSISGALLDPSVSSLVFYGLQRQQEINSVNRTSPSRDVANLPTIEMFGGVAELSLGSFATDSSGDYAADDEVGSLRKRILRRFFTKKNGFASLPGYGIGLQDYGKLLGSSRVRQQISTDSEKQINQEPEVAKSSVSIVSSSPGVYRLIVRVRTKKGTGFKIQQSLLAS